MNPYVTGLMVQAHNDDLLADAARHRLLAEAVAGGPPRAGLLTRLRETARRLTQPVPAPDPRAACCPA